DRGENSEYLHDIIGSVTYTGQIGIQHAGANLSVRLHKFNGLLYTTGDILEKVAIGMIYKFRCILQITQYILIGPECLTNVDEIFLNIINLMKFFLFWRRQDIIF